KDGELIILDIPDEVVKYGDSDTVAVLSALSLQSEDFDLKEIVGNSEVLMFIKVFEDGFKAKQIRSYIKAIETEGNESV
ncbi:hypothetical protein, partial [Staphylococcus hominis]